MVVIAREAFRRLFPYVILLFDLDHQHDMKRNHSYEEVFKSKRPSLGSIHGAGPATSTSTLITSTTDNMPPIPASDVTASAQVAAGVSVSVQLCQSHLRVLTYCYRADRS